ncbi:hypothetical protein H0O00_03810 [Candidatus Micrarchaeota archaeon]|nr:hypothetical protein [Candidatus Micrarchaeota archaeon]
MSDSGTNAGTSAGTNAGASSGASAVTLSKDMIYGIVILGLVAVLAISVFTQGFGIMKPNVQTGGNEQTGMQSLPDDQLTSKLQDYVNANLLGDGYTAEVTKLEKYDDYIKLATLDITDGSTVVETGQAYITNDGTSIFFGGARLNETVAPPSGQDSGTDTGTDTAVQKVDKPKAQAFVMSYCPYGLQFLKAYVPVMELLGDKADLEVAFVDYSMHGKKEIDANSYIYCVQKEQKPKLAAYLRCFLESGDYAACVATAGVDSAKLDTCVAQLDAQYNITALYNDQSTWAGGQFPQYPVETDLNSQYGVQGSPTFVLNGQQVSVSRSADAVKEAICASFNNPPAECNTTLRTDQEAAGLGAVASGTTTGSASCG